MRNGFPRSLARSVFFYSDEYDPLTWSRLRCFSASWGSSPEEPDNKGVLGLDSVGGHRQGDTVHRCPCTPVYEDVGLVGNVDCGGHIRPCMDMVGGAIVHADIGRCFGSGKV